MTLNKTVSLLYLVFVFSVAKGAWVETLDIDEDYGSDCNAKVTCNMYSASAFFLVTWKCVGGPYGIPDMKKIPGLILGDLESKGFNKYKQSVTLSKCYSKLVLTCEVDGSSRTATLTSVGWVERLDIDKDYGSGCNAKVTCYVHSNTPLDFVGWKCIGGPYGITDMNQIPGLRTGDIMSVGLNKYKQSVTLSKCYSKLVLTCEVDGSSRTVTLTPDPIGTLTVGQITGIVVVVVLVLSAIGACVGLALRRRRTQGVVVREAVNPMTIPVAPTYPVQTIPAGYPGYPNPPPYPQAN